MKNSLKTAGAYILLILLFMLISSGAVINAFADARDSLGWKILLPVIPMTILFVVLVLVNDKVGIPRLLLRGRFVAYTLFTLLLSYFFSYASLWAEYFTRNLMNLPQRVGDMLSPWLFVDTLSNCILLFMIMLGLGVWQLFRKWHAVTERENRLAARLADYIREVKERLSAASVLAAIDNIAATIDCSGRQAVTEIRELSDSLRQQLYRLPASPVQSLEDESPADGNFRSNSRMASILTDRRFSAPRNIAFLSLVALISMGTLFDTPDHPVFTLSRFAGCFAMFIFMAAIAYVNILWLFRRFYLRRSLRRYAAELSLLIAACIIPMILTEIATYDPNIYRKSIPVGLMVISSMASMTTLFLYLGGIGALIMFQHWIRENMNLALLRAETARQEYACLRKQVNPHFLFNVLNNAGILIEEDPDEARAMLMQLRLLLERQFAQTDKAETSLADELEFLTSYLRLEASRIEPFEFEVEADKEIEKLQIPTLLFISFVENAVKYSSVIDGQRRVEISFKKQEGNPARLRQNTLLFKCVNAYDPTQKRKVHSGGVGIANTRRRLELLYGNRFSLTTEPYPGHFAVELEIPVNR